LGVHVSAINLETALVVIDDWIRRRDSHYVCVTGVHGVMESHRDEEIRWIHNTAGLVTPDGVPLVWLSRWMGFSNVSRVYGPDLMLAVCAQSARTGYRHFFYGGAAGVPEKLVARLQARFPGLKAVGAYSPPFRVLSPAEDTAIVSAINTVQPDIVWVGMSTPKQEQWMAEHVGRLCAPVLIGVGAAFDFVAGLKRQAPAWMRKSGLEWSFRLLSEPRRLWRRYLINNPVFLWLVALEALERRRKTAEADCSSVYPPSDRPIEKVSE
jgi:N-acetylglucosaminyldiphosphoundecaprenol N-acetyl-beta-D-mannosaminyltransferase